jgi:hypothetical protein
MAKEKSRRSAALSHAKLKHGGFGTSRPPIFYTLSPTPPKKYLNSTSTPPS